MKVVQMLGRTGKPVANQFTIFHNCCTYFQSYGVIVAKIDNGVTLDKVYWDYSRTTMKYLVKFLYPIVNNATEIRNLVKSGKFKLDDLNDNLPF